MTARWPRKQPKSWKHAEAKQARNVISRYVPQGSALCPAWTPGTGRHFPEELPIGNPVENSPGNWKSSPGTYRSYWPLRTPAVKASHSWGLNTSTGPVRSLVSRTATAGSVTATSTHAAWPLLWVLLRHAAGGMLVVFIVLAPLRPGG